MGGGGCVCSAYDHGQGRGRAGWVWSSRHSAAIKSFSGLRWL